jgi:hypothetical protein
LADESGQGIVFAAATLLLLVGFVAFVFNIGRLLDRRTKVQVAADAAAYSGAMVEADAVSAIAYINSAMSQVYYNALKCAVDMNESAVAAELERRMNYPSLAPSGQAWTAYSQTVYPTARAGLQQAKQWMLQLSQLENAIAIVTPRLVQEEMFAVGGRAGGERMSVYPSFRMFPMNVGPPISYLISCLGNGWQIINLTTGTTETLTVTLNGTTWDIQWSNDPSPKEVQISQTSPTSWQIQYFQPPGTMVQQVSIVLDPNLGWTVAGSSTTPVTFTPVTVGGSQAVQVSQGGYSQVLLRNPDGTVSVWNSATNSFQQMTQNSTPVGNVNVQANVTNTINFAGGGTAHIGNPTTMDIGGTHIVLSNPPNISTGSGPVRVWISGFNPNQFSVTAGGMALTANSNGRWNSHYSPSEESWSRNRLVVMGPNQWEYDYERLGALLQYEPNNGNIAVHAFMDSGNGYTSDSSTWPAWTAWFNPYPFPMPNSTSQSYEMPYDYTTGFQKAVAFGPPDSSGISHALSAPPGYMYYQTATGRCAFCGGTGMIPGGGPGSCPVCLGLDNCYPNVNYSNVRVFIGDLWPNSQNQNIGPSVIQLMAPQAQNQNPDDYYLGAPMIGRATDAVGYPNSPAVSARMPLVATEDFFKWGVNVGVWKHAYNGVIVPSDTPMPMLFPDPSNPAWKWEPPWGTVAIASARVGLSTANGGIPSGGVALPNSNASYLCQFSDAADRTTWCQSSLQNLYYADVQAQLFASKNQVSDFDLDEAILAGTPVNAIDESGLSYLWSAVLAQNIYGYRDGWLDRFNGQADPRVGNALRNMQNRQGATFDYGSGELNQVVEH